MLETGYIVQGHKTWNLGVDYLELTLGREWGKTRFLFKWLVSWKLYVEDFFTVFEDQYFGAISGVLYSPFEASFLLFS